MFHELKSQVPSLIQGFCSALLLVSPIPRPFTPLILFTSDERFPSITRLPMNYCYAGISLLELEYPVMHSALTGNFPRLDPNSYASRICIIIWLAVSALPSRGMLPTYTAASAGQLRRNQSLRLVSRSCERCSISPDSLRSEFPRPAAFTFAFWMCIGNSPYFCIGGRCRRATSTRNTPAKELAIDANYGPFLTKGCTRPIYFPLIRVINGDNGAAGR